MNRNNSKNEMLEKYKHDYQDISRRASIIIAENIQLKDELSRLKMNVASAANNKLGVFNVDAFRVDHLQLEMKKLQDEYKKEMENNIEIQRKMMNEMNALQNENRLLKKELKGYDIIGLPSSPNSNNSNNNNNGKDQRHILQSTSPYSNRKKLELIKKYKNEIYALTKKLSYAEIKLETTITNITKKYKTLLIVKEKELIKLRKKVLQTENEESEKSKVIHNKLASLLSKTDKRNPENKKTKLNRNRDHEIKQLQIQLNEAMNMLKENEENYNFHLKQMAVEHEELETELEYTKNDLDQLKNHL